QNFTSTPQLFCCISVGGGLSSTQNTYDPLDNLENVVQGTQTRTFDYSSLSRLVSSTQPENGTTVYKYDNNGNLLSRQDARGAATGKSEFLVPVGSPATEFAYDGLGRPRRKRIQELGANREVIWTWDTATNGKGRLASVAYGGTTVSYTGYDKVGRVKNHKQTTDNVDYPFAYSYFRNDEVASITYPSGKVMTYALDGAGRPLNGGTPTKTYVGTASYTAHGAVGQMTFGTGKLQLSYTFNNKLQTTLIKTEKISPSLTELQRLEYDYHVAAATENNGNPRKHRIIETGGLQREQQFNFDAANRLTGMTEGGGTGSLLNQSFHFDTFGNRWVTSPNSTISGPAYTPQAAGAFDPATNRFSAAVMQEQFDAAGHSTVTELGAIASEWDSEGRRVKTTYQSYTPTYYSFDGAGQRVKKLNSSWGSYIFVYDAFGRLAAEYGAGQAGECLTCYPLVDTTGSTRLVANENGDVVQRFDWTGQGNGIHNVHPWANGRTGPEWDSSSVFKQQFGGYYRDEEVLEGNVEFSGTRTYKRNFNRFLSPDENLVDQDPADPLSWNLYAYARGNPVKYSDPTGRGCVYLNSSGTEVASVDNEIESRQCGGYWVDGTVTQAKFSHGSLHLTGTTDGTNRTSASYGLGPDPGLMALKEAGIRASRDLSTSAIIMGGTAVAIAGSYAAPAVIGAVAATNEIGAVGPGVVLLKQAAERGAQLVKQFKLDGIGQGAGRSGGHGTPFIRAGAELIRQANNLPKNDPMRAALKQVGERLIGRGKSIDHR
ncbi:MAG: hypothetical protein FJW30_28910, partial [Acidobacteria bacterium]|nr:hypothetical protein [Acidobacteriota bacterium]